MTVGKIIEDVDYNRIRNKIAQVLGPGGTNPLTGAANPNFGYGQNLQSSTVSLGNTVTKEQWDNLRWDIVNARVHQTGSVPSIQTVTANSKIQASVLNYESIADAAITNRLTVAPSNLAPEGGTPSTGASTTRTLSWSTTVTSTVTVTFASAAQARYFFNAGGKIRFGSTFVRSLNNAQNISWENLLTGPRIITFDVSFFYALTSSFTSPAGLRVTATPTVPYGVNRWQISPRVNVANNSNGTATQIIFRSEWIDAYVDPGPPAPGDLVQGTLSLVVDQQRPIGTLQPDNDSFLIAGPTSYSITSIA